MIATIAEGCSIVKRGASIVGSSLLVVLCPYSAHFPDNMFRCHGTLYHPSECKIHCSSHCAGVAGVCKHLWSLRILASAGFVNTRRLASGRKSKKPLGQGCHWDRQTATVAFSLIPSFVKVVQVDVAFLAELTPGRPGQLS